MKGHELGATSTVCVNGVNTPLKDAPEQAGAERDVLRDPGTGNPDLIPVVVIAERRVPAVSSRVTNETIGDAADDTAAASVDRKGIVGRDDRAHHLALGSGAATPRLLPPKAAKAMALPYIIRRGRTTAVKPHSRADGEGRCGMNGYCDPWDENGCGGLYCGRR